VLSNNIPTPELSFWSPVTYYDYDNEQNQKNRTILVLDKRYSGKMATQLKTLLK
jgi:hypothetical protein